MVGEKRLFFMNTEVLIIEGKPIDPLFIYFFNMDKVKDGINSLELPFLDGMEGI